MNEFAQRLIKLADPRPFPKPEEKKTVEVAENKEEVVKETLGTDPVEQIYKLMLPIEQEKVAYLKGKKDSWESDYHYDQVMELLEKLGIPEANYLDYDMLMGCVEITLNEAKLANEITKFVAKFKKI